MNEIKLLILDDDQDVIDSYNEITKRINRDNQSSFTYKIYPSRTLGEAREIMKYNKLDTAIIDLNLNNGNHDDPDNADGNHAIKELMKNFRMPIFVVSGELTKLDDKLKSNDLIKQHSREKFTTDNGFESIIPPLYESKSIHYFSKDGFLEQKINEFYWDNLSKTINSWKEVGNDYPDDIEKILSRHTVACLNEQLYVNGNVGSFDKYHPGEMYIIPPIKKHYHTGDILTLETDRFIILNPACDIVNEINLDHYVLIRIVDFSDLPKLSAKINPNSPSEYFYDKLNKKGKNCFDDCKANKKDRFHYLPSFDIMEDKVIDFQQIVNVALHEIENYQRDASISSPFLKDIIARFSSYYARQGQPNLLV